MESESHSTGATVTSDELRQRLPANPSTPQKAESVEDARQTVSGLNASEERSNKADKDKKTFGRTPDGTVFTVPTTHDMVSQLLSPTEPKNFGDLVVIVILGLHLIMLAILPKFLAVPFFAIVYLFWRVSYNGGIGYLLYEQSNYNTLVNWAKKTGIFEDPNTGKNHYAWAYPWLKREMETKIPKDYKFAEAPIEYNTWLTFRRVVDLILMCDFTAYCCFAHACGGTPAGENFLMTMGRWAVGWILIFFNLWVKLDAHRVVKDFAWYWGDFFYLIDQDLTFDGVFQMAPHPMYSVGYAGYYGISLMAASYKVLFISIFAHACQFAFLAFVESPHIEKTYNPPAARTKVSVTDHDRVPTPKLPNGTTDSGTATPQGGPSGASASLEEPFTRDIIGIDNYDPFRLVDVATALMQIYIYAFALFTPNTFFWRFMFVINAAAWRIWYSAGIGYILNQQSERKMWTRHFIKHGESYEEAWRQWKGIYHFTMTMCYASFFAAAYKLYALPHNWEYGATLLRHVLGTSFIALQIWTVTSMYDSLGEFGWFFGDFFFDRGPTLNYDGIYRFLNNPERVIGLAGVWGAALITWSPAMFFLAFLSHGLTLYFIHFVERPHMQKRYGQTVREHSGLSTSIKNSLPPALRKRFTTVDKAVSETSDFIEEFMESARPKFAAGYNNVVKDTQKIFRNYPARISVTRLAPDLAGFDSRDYSLEVEGVAAPQGSAARDVDKVSGREGDLAREASFRGAQYQPMLLEYGAPIKVRWSAPLNHSKNDWVGLYMVADNSSRDVTRVGSQGRWIATSKSSYESARPDVGQVECDQQKIIWDDRNGKGEPRMTGEMEFSGDKLWWTTGVFEFRYHHDGKHNVMAVSQPFEIRIGRFDEVPLASHEAENEVALVENALLPVVRNCFDRDPNIAPTKPEEGFGGLVEREGRFAKRVIYAILQMFGIELSPSVVKADGCVRNLAWRIVQAKRVLAPYSMSQTPKGSMTPEESP